MTADKDKLEWAMRNQHASHGMRVTAWILRYSLAVGSSFAIHLGGTRPRLQADCARELHIPPQEVSRKVAALKKRGYLENRPKLLVPTKALAPLCTAPAPADDSDLWGAIGRVLPELFLTEGG